VHTLKVAGAARPRQYCRIGSGNAALPAAGAWFSPCWKACSRGGIMALQWGHYGK
jgi:hypothetical protein